MPKEEWGTKRLCPTTGKRFYDLNKDPIVSPYTGEVVSIDANKGRTMVADAEDAQTKKMAEAEAESEDVVLDEDDDVEEEDDEIDTEKLAKAIENAQKTGLIKTGDSAEKIAEKQKKKLQRQFQRCASASLRPINECIADRNKKIDGTDDVADDDDDDGDSY